MTVALILTINTGSSSVKVAAYRASRELPRVFSASVTKIGGDDAMLKLEDGSQEGANQHAVKANTPVDALALVMRAFERVPGHEGVRIVGHRVVHGGAEFSSACLLDDKAMTQLEKLVDLAPDHMPQALEAIHFIAKRNPNLAQMAAFDTSFHHTMPAVASQYALPYSFAEQAVRRYGFHGLSYTYITQQLRRIEPDLASRKLVIAHLGSGASMAAISDGKSVDTSMGFSPDSGLVMSTRAGDIDAAAVLYLIKKVGMTPAQVSTLLNTRSGLLGISELSADMHTLLENAASDRRAAAAVEMFCYRVRRTLGGYCAALGGIDALIFAGGIGENSVEIRQRICTGLEFLGLEIDEAANATSKDVISTPSSRAQIRVMATDEDLIIAQEAAALLQVS